MARSSYGRPKLKELYYVGPVSVRPQLEALEDRTVPSLVYYQYSAVVLAPQLSSALNLTPAQTAGPGVNVAFLSQASFGAAFSAPSVEDPTATMPTAPLGGEAEQGSGSAGLTTALASPGARHRSEQATEVLFSNLARDEGSQPPPMAPPPMGSAVNFDTSS